MKRKHKIPPLTDKEFNIGSVIWAVTVAVCIAFFGFSYSIDPAGTHGEITTASTVLSFVWIAVTLIAAFAMGFVNNRAFLYGCTVSVLIDALVFPFFYGFCAAHYPAYMFIGERVFTSAKLLDNLPDSGMIFEPIHIALVYGLHFLARRIAKKRTEAEAQ